MSKEPLATNLGAQAVKCEVLKPKPTKHLLVQFNAVGHVAVGQWFNPLGQWFNPWGTRPC